MCGLTLGATGALSGLTRGSGLGWCTAAGRFGWMFCIAAGAGSSINRASMGSGSTGLWGGFAIKYANPHNAIAQISRADGSVQGRRRQGLSILQYVFIKVVSLNMFDCDQEMLRTRIAGLQHRLDGDTL